MAWAKVQDESWGSGSFSAASTGTMTAHFVSLTVAGNLLLCFVTCSTDTLGTTQTPTIQTPTAPGFTWTLIADSGVSPIQTVAGHEGNSRSALFYITNAAAMGTGVNTSCTCTTPSNVGTLGINIDLFEFSGEEVASVIDASLTGTGLSTTPSAGSIAAAFTDLLFVGAAYPASQVAVGTGFTLTTNTVNDDSGNSTEYKLNAAAGSYTAGFNAGGLVEPWSCVAAAFKPFGSGGGGGAGPALPNGVTAASEEHNPTGVGNGVVVSTDGNATGCGTCSGPHLLQLIPGFSDLPDSVLQTDDPAFALHVGEIAFNATFGMVRCEVFTCLLKHGDVVPLPRSCWDGYQYSRQELIYTWTVQNSTDPSTNWISGPDSLWFANWNVRQNTGEVFCEEWYERSSTADTRLAAKSNDGLLMIFCIAQRQKTNMFMGSTASYTSISESTIAIDKPFTQDLAQHLNQNAKFSCVNSEVFYLGEYVSGETVTLPVSAVDGYHYIAGECKFLHAWRWTASQGSYVQPPGNLEQAAPFQASISSSGVVSIVVTFSTNGGEDVTTPSGYGRIAAFAFCTRSATPSTASLANAFTELDLDFFAPGSTVRASELLTIKRNIDEAVLSPEFFGPTDYKDTDVIPLPVSAVDGYTYARAELQYVWSWADTKNNAGGSHVRLPLFLGSIGPLTGMVTLRAWRLPPGGPFVDDANQNAVIRVLVMATRHSTHPVLALGAMEANPPADAGTPTIARWLTASVIEETYWQNRVAPVAAKPYRLLPLGDPDEVI